MTFSALVANATGAAFAPTLFVETPSALDNWTTSTVQNNAGAGDALQSIASGTTLRVTWSANISAYPNIANGLSFRLRFPSGTLGVNTKSVSVSEVQLEAVTAVGAVPSLFEVANFGDALLRCQRFYYKTFPYTVAPAQNPSTTSNGAHWFNQPLGASILQYMAGPVYPAVMRVSPTVVFYNPSAANGHPYNPRDLRSWSATTLNAIHDRGLLFFSTSPAGSAAGRDQFIHVTADAEL